MFRVSERRKALGRVPGVLLTTLLVAESTDEYKEEGKSVDRPYMYATLKYKGHDDFRTLHAAKERQDDGTVQVAFEQEEGQWEVDIPAFDFADSIIVEVWETRHAEMDEEEEELDDETERNLKVGEQRIPVQWVLNQFGAGYGAPSEETATFNFFINGADGLSHPWKLECRLHYRVDKDHVSRAVHRWCTRSFEGKFTLDRSSSTPIDPLLAATRVPFVIRKMEEEAGPEKLEIRMMNGGNACQFITSKEYITDDTGPILINELFQSAKSHLGTVVEKRLYWDSTSMEKITKDEPYPHPILMSVTRYPGDVPEVVEAWDLSSNGAVLTQLIMMQGLDTKFKRVFVREPEEVNEPKPPPKVVTRDGTLTVAVLNGEDLRSDGDGPMNAYCALNVWRFKNKDTQYKKPLNEKDSIEKQTRYFEDDPNPDWNQVFNFDIKSEKGQHHIIVAKVYNRRGNSEVEVGTVRIPVPWVYNGFGTDMGPDAVAEYESLFKLRQGKEALDPAARVRYGNGRIRLRLSYRAAPSGQ